MRVGVNEREGACPSVQVVFIILCFCRSIFDLEVVELEDSNTNNNNSNSNSGSLFHTYNNDQLKVIAIPFSVPIHAVSPTSDNVTPHPVSPAQQRVHIEMPAHSKKMKTTTTAATTFVPAALAMSPAATPHPHPHASHAHVQQPQTNQQKQPGTDNMQTESTTVATTSTITTEVQQQQPQQPPRRVISRYEKKVNDKHTYNRNNTSDSNYTPTYKHTFPLTTRNMDTIANMYMYNNSNENVSTPAPICTPSTQAPTGQVAADVNGSGARSECESTNLSMMDTCVSYICHTPDIPGV